MNNLKKFDKENNHILNERKMKKVKLCQLNHRSMTESIFHSKKHSIKIADSYEKVDQEKQFYSTFGTSMSGNWVRPESKKEVRHTIKRPETSKGIRDEILLKKNICKKINHKSSKSLHNNAKDNKNIFSEDNEFINIEIVLNKR